MRFLIDWPACSAHQNPDVGLHISPSSLSRCRRPAFIIVPSSKPTPNLNNPNQRYATKPRQSQELTHLLAVVLALAPSPLPNPVNAPEPRTAILTPAEKMHLWPSLRIRDSFKHGYLQKLELNLGHMKREQRQRQGQQGEAQEDQEGKAPLLEDRSPSPPGSVLAGALELAWDAVLLFTCCCCCFCCGACSDEEDHPTAR